MRCEEFESLLADLTGGRLRDAEQAACLQHAEHCARCAGLLATVRGNQDAVPPDDLAEGILEQTSKGSCREARSLLCDHVDGALRSSETLLLGHHLEVCKRCRLLAEALAISHALLPSLAQADPGRDFAEAVFRRTHRLPARPERPFDSVLVFLRSLFVRPRFALEAAYVGALLLFGLYGLIPGDSLPPAVVSASPIPVGIHQTVSEYAAPLIRDLTSQSRTLFDRTTGWAGTTGELLGSASTASVSEIEDRYRDARAWLDRTLKKTRSRIEQEWHGTTDHRPTS